MALSDSTIIIADDLTGANDTALQFFKRGCKTRIIIDCYSDFLHSEDDSNCEIWSISTESRNVDKKEALNRVVEVSKKLISSLEIQNFYKKIDSTLRGNTGVEILGLLEVSKKDLALVVPAYIEEGRTTIGAYQLLNNVPIERTQCALDPKSPICDSYIPNILKKDLNEDLHNLIGTIGFDTIAKGAGPIVLKISELVQSGKKIVVADAMSTVDLEQIALAINKSSYDILPCASAGLAQAMNKIADFEKNNTNFEKDFSKTPRFIVSGSATALTKKQIEKLKEEKNIFVIDLTVENVINEIDDTMADLIIEKLKQKTDVVVHSSYINDEINSEESSNKLIDAGIAKNELSSDITDFLSGLVERVNQKSEFILITIGGETSYKCAKAIDSVYLEILDAILPAVPLCRDKNGKFFITKSGNFGTADTLINILNYFK